MLKEQKVGTGLIGFKGTRSLERCSKLFFSTKAKALKCYKTLNTHVHIICWDNNCKAAPVLSPRERDNYEDHICRFKLIKMKIFGILFMDSLGFTFVIYVIDSGYSC